MNNTYPYADTVEDKFHPEDRPPVGMCWSCPDCESWSTVEDNARAHRWKTNHSKAVLQDLQEARDDQERANEARKPKKVTYHMIAWATLEPDVYDEDNPHKPKHFRTYAEGDKQDSFEESLTLWPDHYPPGTKISIEVPVCPDCGTTREDCVRQQEFLKTEPEDLGKCTFDWEAWDHDQFG